MPWLSGSPLFRRVRVALLAILCQQTFAQTNAEPDADGLVRPLQPSWPTITFPTDRGFVPSSICVTSRTAPTEMYARPANATALSARQPSGKGPEMVKVSAVGDAVPWTLKTPEDSVPTSTRRAK